MSTCIHASILLIALASLCGVSHAGEIPRDQYLRYVPLDYPKQIREADASRDLQIWGDERSPDYRDLAPRDGIDDRRGKFFSALASRFAPHMVLNTSNLPMDFEKVMTIQGKSEILVDHWDVSGAQARLKSIERIDLNEITSAPCPRAGEPDNADCKLLELMKSFSPTNPTNPWLSSPTVQPRSAPFSVPFVDFIGDSPESWKAEYEDPETGQLAEKYHGTEKAYVHPLVQTVKSTQGGAPLYELVLQYWFFYPLNDADNKHKGDWEHINVAVTPLSRLGKGLTASDVQTILARDTSRFGEDSDPLVIGRLDYYFHSFVMMLDFSKPNAYLPRADWERRLKRLELPLERERICRLIRIRAWVDPNETAINTHPVVYIGADSKGLSLILYPPGHRNRDGHGSYPFRGLYKNIGPASSAEEIRNEFEDPWPDSVILYDRPEMLEIIPDWERILDLAYREPETRRRWYWLLIPLRWGYPTIRSKFAGIVPHAETGNLASISPPFHVAWNRPGTGKGTTAYNPFLLKGIIPLSPIDTMHNNWGWINGITVLLTTLPPLDVVFNLVASPAKGLVTGFTPVFYPAKQLPYRFASLGVGGTSQFMPVEWNELFLNANQFSELLTRLSAVDPQGGNSTNEFADTATSAIYQLQLFLGSRFVTENWLRHAVSGVGFDVPVTTRPEPFRVRGDVEMWELAGSLRYNFFTEAFQPFVRIGYGWSWYRLRDVTTDGVPLSTPTSAWIDQPDFFPPTNLFPNEWHVGFGLEFVPIRKRTDVFHGIGFGAKFDLTYTTQTINVNFDSPVGLGLRAPQLTSHRLGLSLAAIVSF